MTAETTEAGVISAAAKKTRRPREKRGGVVWVSREWTDPETGKLRREKVTEVRDKHDRIVVKGVSDSDVFVTEWLEPDRRRRRERAGQGRHGMVCAFELLDQLKLEMRTKTYQSNLVKQRTDWKSAVESYIKSAVATVKKRRASQRDVLATLKRFEAAVQPKKLDDITFATIEAFKRVRMADKAGKAKIDPDTGEKRHLVSNGTINKDLRNLNALFRWLVDAELMQKAPKIVKLKESPRDKPSFSEEEFLLVFNHCDVATFPRDRSADVLALWWQTYLALMWETGARQKELLSIRWENVNMPQRTIYIEGEFTKSGKPRYIDFGDLGEACLSRLAKLGDSASLHDRRVFVQDMSRMNRNSHRRQLARIQQAAGLDPNRWEWKFHSIRRTVGEMTTDRYSLTAAQHKLGHTSARITEKHYAKQAVRRLASQSPMPIPAGLKIVG